MLRMLALAALVLSAGGAVAQESPAPPQPQPSPSPSPAAPKPAKPPGSPLAHLRLGAFEITPYLRINHVGFNSNVYTPTGPRADFNADASLGLDVSLPFARWGFFSLGGDLGYSYYLRTPSLRRRHGSGAVGLSWNGERTFFSISERLSRSYSRIGAEVDQPTVQDTEGTSLELKRHLFSRISLTLHGSRTHNVLPEEQSFVGANLRPTLSTDRTEVGGGLEYAITVKTSLVADVSREESRFLYDRALNSTSLRLFGGIRTDSTALIAGHLRAGWQRFRAGDRPENERREFVADATLSYHLSSRTTIGGSYGRGRGHSAFLVLGPTPTVLSESYGANFEQRFSRRLDLRIFGNLSRLRTDGLVTITAPGQPPTTAVRDETTRSAGLNLGYTFRDRLRAGAQASYLNRNSVFSYFGVRGLSLGVTVDYYP